MAKQYILKKEHILLTVLFSFIVLALYLFYRILAPFLIPLCWSAIFVVIFYPLYQKADKYIKSPNLRSLLFTLLIVLLIIGPAVYLGVSLAQEAMSLFDYFKESLDQGKLDEIINIKNSTFYLMVQNKLAPYVDLSQLDLRVIVEKGLQSVSHLALVQTTNVLTNTGKVIIDFSLMVFFMFYFFRDGEKLFNQIMETVPADSEKSRKTLRHMRKVIEGTMYGGVVISILQGFIGGVMFLIMGLQSPVLWGVFMAFLAFIPIVGPSMIYIPAGLILIFTGSTVKGVLLIVIGTFIVSQIDNFLRPMLVSGKTGMHTMLLFISILGGIYVFGLLGIVLGPFIAAVFVTMFDVFRLRLTENGENESDEEEQATSSE
ncbi:MAG: AI-2E family transporter [candidate division Zixibacteria bacterium]|nr:AI-2E family transporter [candidate division Zixibacteria bacterium]